MPDEPPSPTEDSFPAGKGGPASSFHSIATEQVLVGSGTVGPVPSPVYAPAVATGPLRQCEILSDLVQVRQTLATLAAQEELEVEFIRHPYALIISQDCDLDQDFAARFPTVGEPELDKFLPNVLFCEASTAEAIYGLTRPKGRDIWKRILQNNDQRYHFLQRVQSSEDALALGLPELCIDFKRHFSIPTDEVYARLRLGTKRRSQLLSPYLEHFASRFSHFLSRVALPADHVSE